MLEARLELSIDPNQLPSLQAALERAGAAPGDEPSLITSIYYDTPGRKLHDQGLSLRVEQHDTRRVQVLRRRASIGDSRQWRDVISSEGPDPLAPETGARLRGLIEDELRPLCKTQIRRTCWRLGAEPSVETKATLDEGEILATVGDATEPVCDLALEMTEGDPAVLFDAALQLLDAAPLRITTRDHAERARRLLGGAIEATTAEPLSLVPSMTVEAVLQITCRACVWHLVSNERAALAGNAEAIHQMRVAVRRLGSCGRAIDASGQAISMGER